MKRNILHAIEFVDIDSEEQIDVNITTEPDIGTVYSVAVPIRRVKPEARLALDQDGEIEDLTSNGTQKSLMPTQQPGFHMVPDAPLTW